MRCSRDMGDGTMLTFFLKTSNVSTVRKLKNLYRCLHLGWNIKILKYIEKYPHWHDASQNDLWPIKIHGQMKESSFNHVAWLSSCNRLEVTTKVSLSSRWKQWSCQVCLLSERWVKFMIIPRALDNFASTKWSYLLDHTRKDPLLQLVYH